MSKADKLIEKRLEEQGNAGRALKDLIKVLESEKVHDARMHVEMALDEAGLLKDREGKAFYEADDKFDKAVNLYKRLQKTVK